MGTGLRLWIDDVREPPDESWEWVTTSEAAIATLEFFAEDGMLWCPREAVSFEHDLGGDDTTRPVVIWMIENGFRFNQYIIHGDQVKGMWLYEMIERYLL